MESQGIEFAQHGHTAFQELTSPVAQGIWSPHKRLDPGPNLAAGGIYFRRGCPIPKGTRTARRAVREVQIPCDAMESQGIEFAQHGPPLFPEHFS
ncbi:MAG: hypothetical protein ACLSAF_06265 [Intestinimonas sp.]